MSVNFNGTPVGTPPANAEFLDFYQDSSKVGTAHYYASFYSGDGDSTHLYENTMDSYPDYTEEAGGGSMSITWNDNKSVFSLHEGSATTSVASGSMAYDSQGNAVGLYVMGENGNTDNTGNDNTTTTTNINPIIQLTPDTTASDALIATFSIAEGSNNGAQNWSLLDTDLNGVVDRATNTETYYDYNHVQQTDTEEYIITWSDATHFTARSIFNEIEFGSTFDSQGRPTTIPMYNYNPDGEDIRVDVPITWQARDAYNVVGTFVTEDELGKESGKFLDTNGDNLPDQVSMRDIYDDITYTTTAKLIGWENLSSTNPNAVSAEVLISNDPQNMFSGTITGTSSAPTSVIITSYVMGGSEVVPVDDIHNSDGTTTTTIRNIQATYVVEEKEVTGTFADLKSWMEKTIATAFAPDAAITHHIEQYLAQDTTRNLTNVEVLNRTFSSTAATTIEVLGGVGDQEAYTIDATGLADWSQINLNDIDFATIFGDKIKIQGGDGANYVVAGDGSQDILLGAGDDTLYGGAGDDIIGSTTGNDQIFGDDGNDTLTGGAGNDSLTGGAGNDTAVFRGYKGDYTITVTDATAGNYIITDNVADRDGTDTLTGIETLQFADPYAASDSSDGISTGVALAGIGGLGLLAWALL